MKTLIFITVIFIFFYKPYSTKADINLLRYVNEIENVNDQTVILDTRPIIKCEKQTLPGARCLPANDFIGPHGRLVGFSNIAWVLGSAGLTGNESVLIIGRNPIKRDFVAGLLHIMGQAQVSIFIKSLNSVNGLKEPGLERDTFRTAIWQAPIRNDAIIFKHELRDILASIPNQILLDGRPENSYWGKTVSASRGGHLPGADHMPARRLRADVIRGHALGPATKNAIVYAHHAIDGIAFMTLVIAGTETPVRVYPGGWAEWANDGSLPVDAESFPLQNTMLKKGS